MVDTETHNKLLIVSFAARLTSLIFQQHNNGFTNEFSERNDKAKPKALKSGVGRNPLIEKVDSTAS